MDTDTWTARLADARARLERAQGDIESVDNLIREARAAGVAIRTIADALGLSENQVTWRARTSPPPSVVKRARGGHQPHPRIAADGSMSATAAAEALGLPLPTFRYRLGDSDHATINGRVVRVVRPEPAEGTDGRGARWKVWLDD